MMIKEINPSNLILNYLIKIFPEVDREMKSYINAFENIEIGMLPEQALLDFNEKKPYLREGNIYSLYPGVKSSDMIKIITSFNMASYYLDNICESMLVKDETAFKQMYLALIDAVDYEKPTSDYFKYCPNKCNDKSLNILVEFCRNHLKILPSYDVVKDTVKRYVQYYCDLQTYKHMEKESREDYLKTWSSCHLEQFKNISWWEFASASESFLGVFALFALAYSPDLTSKEVSTLDSVYFPWICSMHSMLNHYINVQEHSQIGRLNFISYYRNLKECEERLSLFIDKSLMHCSNLKYPEFHATVIKVFIATYLSDPRASFGMNKLSSSNFLKQPPPPIDIYYKACRFLRLIKAV